MSRPLRIEYPGALYHVTSRGNNRCVIFKDNQDRRKFLNLLGHAIYRYRFICYAYCLMDNHYHLLIETREGNLSYGMRQLNGVYGQSFNQRHKSVGHLFQGRFKAILVEKDSYLLELSRYLVRNPVRAGIVEDPAQWPWSSYRMTLGKEKDAPWFSKDILLAYFSSNRGKAQSLYEAFVMDGTKEDSPWKSLRGQIYLGSEKFCERFMKNEKIGEIPREQLKPLRPSLEEIFQRGPDAKKQAVHAYREWRYRIQEIATHLRVHYATIGRWIHRLDEDEC